MSTVMIHAASWRLPVPFDVGRVRRGPPQWQTSTCTRPQGTVLPYRPFPGKYAAPAANMTVFRTSPSAIVPVQKETRGEQIAGWRFGGSADLEKTAKPVPMRHKRPMRLECK